MKNIIIFSFLTIVFFSCDTYDDYYNESITDFSKDISNKKDFYFSTPVALSLLDSKTVNDTAYYKVGDTLKLSLNLNNIYQENTTDFYNLFKSTKSNSFFYRISFNNEIDEKIINLKVLDKYPELASGELSEEQIQTSPYYKDLYFKTNIIEAVLNTKTNNYESKIGLVLKKATGFFNNTHYPLQLNISQNITNKQHDYYSYEKDTKNDIYLYIPIFSSINKSVIYIED